MIDTILVVDGYDTHRAGLASVLRKATGADVIAARNGRIALDEIRQQRWDIVVLDLDLPDMTGLQLIDALARQNGTGGIILTSAHPARLVQAAAAYAQSRGISVLATLEKPLKSNRVRAVAATLQGELRMRRGAALASKQRAVASTLSHDDLLLTLATRRIEGHLQPQHHVDGGRLRGAEILARWRNDDGTLLEPAAFLPAFENAGLMRPLTDYMIEQALAAQVRLAWIRDLSISINIPTGIARSVDWAQQLAQQAGLAGATPSRLVIEIIEDGDASAIPALTGAVTQLRLRGFNCAIDDFGTGSSSLDRLLWVPFNELKIDRHMISQARHHPHARRILSSTIGMARGLGIAVVIEGIESKKDLKLVTDLGGQISQGYLHGKAMTLEAFEIYAATHQTWQSPPASLTAIATC